MLLQMAGIPSFRAQEYSIVDIKWARVWINWNTVSGSVKWCIYLEHNMEVPQKLQIKLFMIQQYYFSKRLKQGSQRDIYTPRSLQDYSQQP